MSPPQKPEVVVKVIGLPRTCTNLVEKLCNQSFQRGCTMPTNWPCWKHGVVYGMSDKVYIPKFDAWVPAAYILCVKDPIQWLNSFCTFETRVPRTAQKDVAFRKRMSWLQRPAYNYRNMVGYKSRRPIDLYGNLNRRWLNFFEKTGSTHFVVKQEDLIGEKAQREFMSMIAGKLSIPLSDKGISPISKQTAPSQRLMRFDYRPKPNSFGTKALEKIIKELDWEVAERLGYDKEESIAAARNQ